MSYDPKQGFPRVVPTLVYEDVRAALGWLAEAFGLQETLRWTAPEGRVVVAEMELDYDAMRGLEPANPTLW